MRYLTTLALILTAFTAQIFLQDAHAGTMVTGGQVVNIRVGNGTTVAAGTALPVTLDVYNVTYTGVVPTGLTLAQSIALPNGAAGTAPVPAPNAQLYLAQGGTAGGEGGLSLSGNGLYMTLTGYNSGLNDVTNPGAAGTEARVVGRLKLSDGTVDTSTQLIGLSGANAVRGTASTNGTDIWVATSAQGIRYTTFANSAGAGTALTVTANERRVGVFNNQLYTTRMSAGIDGVATVGSPAPPTSGTQTVTLLPGMPTATNSPYDFFFANANTVYVADDRNSGAGAGLEKWTFNGTTWSMAYSILVNPTGAGTVGIKSVNGFVDGSGNVTLFGATTGANGNFLYGFSDTLSNTIVANVAVNKLRTGSSDFGGGANWNMRGVALAPRVNGAPLIADQLIDNVDASGGPIGTTMTATEPDGDVVTWSGFVFDSYTPAFGGAGPGPFLPANFVNGTQAFTWNPIGSPRGIYKWKMVASDRDGSDTGFVTVNVTNVPEPASIVLLGCVGAALAMLGARRKA